MIYLNELDVTNMLVKVLDILIILYILYKITREMGDVRKIQIAKNISFLVLIWYASRYINLPMSNWLTSNIVQFSVIIIVVVFQQEIKRFLIRPGIETRFIRSKKRDKEKVKGRLIDDISETCQTLSKKGVGALIVIEGRDKLEEHAETGVLIDASVSKELLNNIFEPNTLLHDGAAIISKERIYSASCFLPLIENEEKLKELGARHRAALGISSDTDAMSIAVSEETGEISTSLDGKLNRNISIKELKLSIRKHLNKN